ncbi:hypothetical protein OJAV_G00217430 [Oryzias javanicus]|uniref:Uncharacterized protein n=1 Tax=Oryzias javanicus TaxID=123683 RepID=A0A437C4D8_ORYJA|nr:hypothetical protein OJAV_G00217430 [Oryzias javanicus]
MDLLCGSAPCPRLQILEMMKSKPCKTPPPNPNSSASDRIGVRPPRPPLRWILTCGLCILISSFLLFSGVSLLWR